jgi:hypothetical protein
VTWSSGGRHGQNITNEARLLSPVRRVLVSLGGADTRILAKAQVDAPEMTSRGIAALIPPHLAA